MVQPGLSTSFFISILDGFSEVLPPVDSLGIYSPGILGLSYHVLKKRPQPVIETVRPQTNAAFLSYLAYEFPVSKQTKYLQ